MKHYWHFGGMGDIIYALAFLATEPEPVKLTIAQSSPHLHGMNQGKILGPLIEPLPYIAKLDVSDYIPYGAIHMRDALDRGVHYEPPNIIRPYWEFLAPERPWTVPLKPWLGIKWHGGDYCVVNRTLRYNDPDFRWGEHLPDGELHFVGTAEEHAIFSHQLGYTGFPSVQKRLVHHHTANLLQAAHVIAGSRGFFGNASSCLAIAQGIGHPRIFTEAGGGTQSTCHGIGSEVILNGQS